jgi:RecA-family ATPase
MSAGTEREPDLGDRLAEWAQGEIEADDERLAIASVEDETDARLPPNDPTPPIEAYVNEPMHVHGKGNGGTRGAEPPDTPTRRPLDWRALESQTPPERSWAIEHWLGMGYVTLLAGPGGAGKTHVAQALGSCLALRREYLDWMPAERRVLMWACEDDVDELWRRQVAIAKWLGASLSEFSDRFIVHSYDGRDVALAVLRDQRLVATRILSELREQIGDYKADAVLLDNLARLYGGNENDRHQVTSFIAMLTAAAAPKKAAVLLLGHPGKAAGSEYSGSTAWEGAVRSRLYLGRSLPDAEPPEATSEDDGVRYLCRRKANYSARDWRQLVYRNGVIVPDAAAQTGPKVSLEYARDVVTRAVRKLAEMGEHGVASSGSPKYLPKLASDYHLLDRLGKKDFTVAMRAMQSDRTLTLAIVGKYANRSPREALALAEDLHK